MLPAQKCLDMHLNANDEFIAMFFNTRSTRKIAPGSKKGK
jgi:hypothetical protein